MRPAPLDPRRARGYHVANALSYFLNPLVLPPVAFALVAWHFGAGALEVAWTFVVALAFFCLIPLLYVVGMIRRGEAESLEVRAQGQRTKPFLVSVASYAVGLVVMALTVRTALGLLVALAAIFPVNTVVLALVNLRWKISVHMAAMAAFCSALLFVALTVWRELPPGPEAALTLATVGPIFVLVPLLMWARVRVGAHTPGQVLAGALFGLLVPFAELYVLVYHVLDLAG